MVNKKLFINNFLRLKNHFIFLGINNMKNTPLITVIVPVYNVEDYLEKCLNSIITQTYKNLDILLINDGSTDNSGVICDKYSLIDNRIRVFHQDNRGVSEARNLGLNNSYGEYIGFVDPDDWIEPEMYEVLLNKLLINNSEISICGHTIYHSNDAFDVRTNSLLEGIIYKKEALTYLLDINLYEGYLWNKLFSAKLINKFNLRFNKNLAICEDLLFVACYMLNLEYIYYIPKPLYNYIERQGSAINSYSSKRQTEILAWVELCELFKPIDEQLYKKSKDRLVKCSVNIILYNVRYGELDDTNEIKKNISGYLKDYWKDSDISIKSKIRTFLILNFPKLSNKVWIFLKNRFHLSWD